MRVPGSIAAIAAATLGCLLALPAAGGAEATFTVASTADVAAESPASGCATPAGSAAKGACTLRSALQAADAAGEGIVSVPAGEYKLTLPGPHPSNGAEGSLVIKGDVQLIGAGAATTIVNGGGEHGSFGSRPLEIATGATARIVGLTFEGGYTHETLADPGGAAVLIEPGADVTLEDEVIEHNVNATTSDGGGVLENSSAGAALPTQATIIDSTIADNSTEGSGGGIAMDNEKSTTTITNSTVADNSAKGPGGGIAVDNEEITTTLTGDTIAENTAVAGGGFTGSGNQHNVFVNDTIVRNSATGVAYSGGGGIELDGGARAQITNSTIASNSTVVDSGGNLSTSDYSGFFDLKSTIVALGESTETGSENANCEGEGEEEGKNVFQSLGYNLQSGAPGEAGGCFAASVQPSDRSSANPLLGALASNGGPTQTEALLSGSPAIAAIPAAQCTDQSEPPVAVATDQRGVTRPQDGTCDIGAYQTERAAPAPTGSTGGTSSTTTTSTNVGVSVADLTPGKCASLRHFAIHIQNAKRLHLVWAKVYLAGRLRKTLHRPHLDAIVNLRGLPRGTFTVRIIARQANGHMLHGKRTYHTCVPHKPGHKHLFL